MKCKTCGLMFSETQNCACSEFWFLGSADQQAIEHHVANIHVGESFLYVAKDALKAARAYPKKVRFAVARHAIECHSENRGLYQKVMTGKF